MLSKLSGPARYAVAVLVGGAGIVLSGCAIGFRAPASDVTANSVTLNGYVGSNRTEPGEWWFRYGTTSTYGSETPRRSVEFTELTRHDVSEPVSGLEPSTTYHYVLCADDQEPGVDEFCSAPQTFRTFADATADSVTVSGSTGSFGNIFIDVTAGPSGETPSGQAAADSTIGRIVASSITCLSVSGDSATIGGALEPNSGGYAGFLAYVTDGGPPDSGLDRFTAGGTSTVPTECAQGFAGPVLSGDAVVVDAPAP